MKICLFFFFGNVLNFRHTFDGTVELELNNWVDVGNAKTFHGVIVTVNTLQHNQIKWNIFRKFYNIVLTTTTTTRIVLQFSLQKETRKNEREEMMNVRKKERNTEKQIIHKMRRKLIKRAFSPFLHTRHECAMLNKNISQQKSNKLESVVPIWFYTHICMNICMKICIKICEHKSSKIAAN